MKTLTYFGFAAALLLSTPIHAATCADLFGRIDAAMESGNTLVRVVTTFTKDANSVAYTRGYLDLDDVLPGYYVATSRRYFNDGTPESPFDAATADRVTIRLRKTGDDSVQVDYLVDAPGTSVGYAATCTSSNLLLALPTTGDVLAVSFRFSTTN